MTFFTAKFDAYLNSLPLVEQIEVLTSYAKDAGADGAWHKQSEINARIASIRTANPEAAAAYDQHVIEARRRAEQERNSRVAAGFAARGID